MALDGVGEPSLVGVGERTEGIRDRRGEPPRIHPDGQLGGELLGEGQAALRPSGASTEGAGDGMNREAILVRQRTHDARLVHRTGGLLGRIRREQPHLADEADGVLDDAGDALESVLLPLGEPLEAVENLVRAVLVRADADRHRSEPRVVVRVGPAERREGSAQGGDRDVDHEVHERGSSIGRSWNRG